MRSRKLFLNNRYRIRNLKLDLIAEGGEGKVYKAKDEIEAKTIALKEVVPGSELARKMAERQAQFLKKLDHPGLIQVNEFFTERGKQYLVMNYIPGDDLGRLINLRKKPFPVGDVLRWGIQILDVLDYLHKRDPPIIHRDIKPQNLKLDTEGKIILLDFGLAKEMVGSTLFTGFTEFFSPPEQRSRSKKGTDPRSDLYALAATLYHLMTGELPPDALERLQVIAKMQPDPLKPANEISHAITPEIADVLGKSLALNPDERWASAFEMQQKLEAVSKSYDEIMRVGNVLTAEIVNFSNNTNEDQSLLACHLEQIVKEVDIFKREQERGRAFCNMTAEGVRIVFFDNMEAPIKCALGILTSLKVRPTMKLRMGINTGPVECEVSNGNIGQMDGIAIKIAEDIMRCGDPGHILVSKAVVDHMEAVEEQRTLLSSNALLWTKLLDLWRKITRNTFRNKSRSYLKHLSDFGNYEIENGEVRIFNLYVKSEHLGNLNSTETKQPIFDPERNTATSAWLTRAAMSVVAVVALIGVAMFSLFRTNDSSPAPAPQITPDSNMVEVVRYHLQSEDGNHFIENEPISAEQGFKIHFLPRENGYFYVITGGGSQALSTLLTNVRSDRTGNLDNKAEAGSDYIFPRKIPLRVDPDRDATLLTVIFSPKRLKTPQFLDERLQRSRGKRITEWNSFREKYKVNDDQLVENKIDNQPFRVVRTPAIRNDNFLMIFDILVRRKRGGRQ